MTVKRRVVALILAVIAAGSPAAGIAAEKNPLLGRWTITEAAAAPWTAARDAPEWQGESKRLMGLTILFSARTVLTKERSLRCKNVAYEVTHFPAEALFQGGLPRPDQEQIAQRMGFQPGLITGVDVNCSAGLFSYHLRPDGRVLFAFNNVIYTLTRR